MINILTNPKEAPAPEGLIQRRKGIRMFSELMCLLTGRPLSPQQGKAWISDWKFKTDNLVSVKHRYLFLMIYFRTPGGSSLGVSFCRVSATTRSRAQPIREQGCFQNREHLDRPVWTHHGCPVPVKSWWAGVHPVYTSAFQHVQIESDTQVCCNCPSKFCTRNPDARADFYRGVL